jgi:lipopolysaccharide export system protein LptC
VNADSRANPETKLPAGHSGASFNQQQARRYTRFVNLMKMLLPGGALALIAALVIYSSLYEKAGERMNIRFQDVRVGQEELRMLNPRFTGVDEKGQPYVVTAGYALQDKGNSDLLKLDMIEADITLNEGAWITAQSASGMLDAKKSLLVFDSSIDVYTDSGYEFHSEDGHVDLKAGIFMSNRPVHGQGPAGKITAGNMTLNSKEGLLMFGGGVKMTLFPSQLESAPLAAKDKP